MVSLLCEKLNWNSIGVQRSAIAAILQPLAERTIAADRAVSLFMRASFLSRRPPRKLKPIWDVGLVLRLLENWGDTPELPRPQLTYRLIMILALASARRVSDLFLLRIDNDHLQRLPTVWKCLPAFGARQERPHHSTPPVIFSQYLECPRLCPVGHSIEYLRRTSKERVRDKIFRLFRTTVTPFRPAAKQTMATWLVSVLKEAATMDTAGSTRAAAATWSAARGVNSSTIMAAADWSNVRIMQNHYIRLLPSNALNVEPSVQNAVLHL